MASGKKITGDEPLIEPPLQVESALSSKDEETLLNQLRDASILRDAELNNSL